MCNTSLKSLFIISLHGMWFLDGKEGKNKKQIWAKLGREGKEVAARRCRMEKEQEQTKGNPDYFWEGSTFAPQYSLPPRLGESQGEIWTHRPKIHSEIEARGEKIVCYPRELESSICHNPVPPRLSPPPASTPPSSLATCCYFFEHCHY